VVGRLDSRQPFVMLVGPDEEHGRRRGAGDSLSAWSTEVDPARVETILHLGPVARLLRRHAHRTDRGVYRAAIPLLEAR
jgi:hypothetical protein